jgi:hypothetical protein
VASWLVQTIIIETFLNPLRAFGLGIAKKEANMRAGKSSAAQRVVVPIVGSATGAWHEPYTTKGATTSHHLGGGSDGGEKNAIVVDEEDMLTQEAMVAVATPSAGWHGGDDQAVVDSDNDVDRDNEAFAVRELLKCSGAVGGGACMIGHWGRAHWKAALLCAVFLVWSGGRGGEEAREQKQSKQQKREVAAHRLAWL